MEPYRIYDVGGDRLEIRSAPDAGIAVIEVCYHAEEDGPTAYVPAHRVAEVVAAMYEAAGQPVPDLPVIHDRSAVDRLARMCHAARFESGCPSSATVDVAAYLLDHGVRLPEATNG